MDYFEFKESFLTEGKIAQSKVRAGDKVEVHAKGSLAKRSGFKKGDNPYGDGVKVKILGLGSTPFGQEANAKQVIAKSVDDFKKKYFKYITDLTYISQKAELKDNRVFFRLLVGKFKSKKEATIFCDNISISKCIIKKNYE